MSLKYLIERTIYFCEHLQPQNSPSVTKKLYHCHCYLVQAQLEDAEKRSQARTEISVTLITAPCLRVQSPFYLYNLLDQSRRDVSKRLVRQGHLVFVGWAAYSQVCRKQDFFSGVSRSPDLHAWCGTKWSSLNDFLHYALPIALRKSSRRRESDISDGDKGLAPRRGYNGIRQEKPRSRFLLPYSLRTAFLSQWEQAQRLDCQWAILYLCSLEFSKRVTSKCNYILPPFIGDGVTWRDRYPSKYSGRHIACCILSNWVTGNTQSLQNEFRRGTKPISYRGNDIKISLLNNEKGLL